MKSLQKGGQELIRMVLARRQQQLDRHIENFVRECRLLGIESGSMVLFDEAGDHVALFGAESIKIEHCDTEANHEHLRQDER